MTSLQWFYINFVHHCYKESWTGLSLSLLLARFIFLHTHSPATREKGVRERERPPFLLLTLPSSASSLFGRRVDWKRAKLPECHCPSSHSTLPLCHSATHSIPSLPPTSTSRFLLLPKNFDIRSHMDLMSCRKSIRGLGPFRPVADPGFDICFASTKATKCTYDMGMFTKI